MPETWQDPTETEQERQARLRREAGLPAETGMGTVGGGTVGNMEVPPQPNMPSMANPRDTEWSTRSGEASSRLKSLADQLGVDYSSELGDVERATRNLGGAGFEAGLSAAEAKLRQRAQPAATSPAAPSTLPSAAAAGYTGGGASTAGGAGQPINPEGSIGDLYRYLQQREATAAQERASMRQVLMDQLGAASRPVDINDPALRGIIDPQRLELQRAAERQRSQMAARLASENLQDSGTFDTAMAAIEQQRGEAAAGVTGRVLAGELQSRRDQLTRLLQLAIQSGDSESARNIQTQLALIEAQIGRESGLNQLGYNYAALQSQLAQALLPYQYVNLTGALG